MPHVSLRVTEEEKITMESYAEAHGVNLSEAVKDAFFQRLEDEYDLQTIVEHREQKAKGEVQHYTHEEVKKELGMI